jgi:hypothetical protein
MSGTMSPPTTDPSVTHFAWTEPQTAAGYEAQGPAACISQMDTVSSTRGEGLNRCDDAEQQGLVNAVMYAAAAGSLTPPAS